MAGGGKDSFGPKALSNRMKAKGLQKLKWYCQICEKQCRDDNGFKCHCLSESHQRMIKLFSENPSKFLSDYSNQFMNGFLNVLSIQFGTKRVQANIVYQEYIKDKEHIHMNSTKWNTLTEFVHYLSRKGLVHLDETPRGWFITWIDNSPQAIARREAKERKEKLDLLDHQRQETILQKQMERAKNLEENKMKEKISPPEEQNDSENNENEEKESEKDIETDEEEEGKKIKKSKSRDFLEQGRHEKISLQLKKPTKLINLKEKNPTLHKVEEKGNLFWSDDDVDDVNIHNANEADRQLLGELNSELEYTGSHENAEKNKMEKLQIEKEKFKKSPLENSIKMGSSESSSIISDGDHPWLLPYLMIRVLNQELGDGKYYKLEGWIRNVKDVYIAEVEMIKSKDIILIDQDDLMPILPLLNDESCFIDGKYRGKKGLVREIFETMEKKRYKVELREEDLSDFAGPKYLWVESSHICKCITV